MSTVADPAATHAAPLAYVAHWFPKPSETFVFHEVRRLRQMGLALRVFTLYGPLAAEAGLPRAGGGIERLGLPFLPRAPLAAGRWLARAPRRSAAMLRRLWCRRWPDAENAAENLWAGLCGFELATRCAARRIGHIHAAWANGPASAAWVASRLTGIPFSFAAHATDIYPPDGALIDKLRACAFARAESRANALHLARLAPDCRSKLVVVHSGTPVRADRPAPAPMTPPLRILGLGRLVAKKGFEVLLRACRMLLDRGCDLRLAIGGDGPRRRALEALALKLGLGGRIHFPGFIPYGRVPAFLEGGDIFVMPSVVDRSGDRDGLPNVVLEALLQRLPVVASDVCAISEVIRHRRTGLLVPPGDPAALAAAVLEIAARRDAALAMAERGRALVRAAFDLDRSCRRMARLFLEHAA
jgi:glycosyltransferase involved in cell wall biosynthesis